jgi:hypothetical protein
MLSAAALRAGSLTNLAKYPASTVQILGAEKALFRSARPSSFATFLSVICTAFEVLACGRWLFCATSPLSACTCAEARFRVLAFGCCGWRRGAEPKCRCAPGHAAHAQPGLPVTPAATGEGGARAQGAEDQGQHAQVRPHLPLLVHRARQAEEQGAHQPLPGQQVLHRVAVRARGAAPGLGNGRVLARPRCCGTPPAAPLWTSWAPYNPKQRTGGVVSWLSACVCRRPLALLFVPERAPPRRSCQLSCAVCWRARPRVAAQLACTRSNSCAAVCPEHPGVKVLSVSVEIKVEGAQWRAMPARAPGVAHTPDLYPKSGTPGVTAYRTLRPRRSARA